MHPTCIRVAIVISVLAGTVSCVTSPGSRAPAANRASSGLSLQQPHIEPAPGSTTGLIPAVVGIPRDPGPAGTHRIAAGDVLSVQVFQADELSTDERVNQDGAVTMSLIGPIDVQGLTTEQAETKIAAALRQDYLQDPQVNIFVKEYANMRVTVGGEVTKPGVFPMTGSLTLLQAVAQAGGLTSLADPKAVVVFRGAADNGITAYVVDLKEVELGKLADPVLAANDKIMVPRSGSAVFLKNLGDTLRGFVRAPVF